MQPLINFEHIPNIQIGLLSEIQPDQQDSDFRLVRPVTFSVLYYLQGLLTRVGINFSRTRFCKHRGTCVCSALVSSTKAGVVSYLIKSGITILFGLKKIFSKPKQVLSALYGKDSIKFGVFVCVFLLVFRAFVCTIRRLLSEEKQKYGFFIGGLIGGTLSSIILSKETRQTFGLFLIARAIDIIYKSLVEKKIIRDFKYYNVVMYSLMMSVTGGFAYGRQPASMSPQLSRFYRSFIQQSPNDELMRRIWIERYNNHLFQTKGIPKYNPMDYFPALAALQKKKK